jgi:hypothetical protein
MASCDDTALYLSIFPPDRNGSLWIIHDPAHVLVQEAKRECLAIIIKKPDFAEGAPRGKRHWLRGEVGCGGAVDQKLRCRTASINLIKVQNLPLRKQTGA